MGSSFAEKRLSQADDHVTAARSLNGVERLSIWSANSSARRPSPLSSHTPPAALFVLGPGRPPHTPHIPRWDHGSPPTPRLPRPRPLPVSDEAPQSWVRPTSSASTLSSPLSSHHYPSYWRSLHSIVYSLPHRPWRLRGTRSPPNRSLRRWESRANLLLRNHWSDSSPSTSRYHSGLPDSPDPPR
jgi:hypothetical protein